MKIIVLSILSAIICLNCSTSNYTHYNDYQLPIDSLGRITDSYISIERTTCFGQCPIYKLLITKEGEAWLSIPNLSNEIYYYDLISLPKIDPQDVQYLFDFSQEIGFYDLDSNYLDDCDIVLTDFPSAITSVKEKEKSKDISHYLGCQDTTITLYNLMLFEEAIDSIANTENYVSMDFNILGYTVIRNVYADSTKK